MNKKNIILAVSGIIILVIGFYGGTLYSKNNTPTPTRGQFGQNGNLGRGVNGGGTMRLMGSGNVSGEIISKDLTTITLKLRDGGSKIIFLTDKTPVQKSVPGNTNDLSIREQVVVAGTPNPDGSLTAQSIQIRPLPSTASSTQ